MRVPSDSLRSTTTMASDETPYILTPEDVRRDPSADAREIWAARNPDSRVLRAILERSQPPSRHPLGIISNPANFFDAICRTLQTPLMVAIKSQLSDNVRVLLEHGADPIGYSLDTLTDYDQNFLRL